MSDFGNMLHPVARKTHRCEWCYQLIPKGDKHSQFKGMWDGDWQNWRMHDECYEDYSEDNDFQDGFTPGSGTRPEKKNPQT